MNTNTCQIKTINNEIEVPTINVIAPKNNTNFQDNSDKMMKSSLHIIFYTI